METGASRLDPNPLQLGCPHSMEIGIGKTICDMSFVIYCINEKRRFMLANRYYRYVNLDPFFFCENVANTFQSFQKVILKQPWSKVVSRMRQIRTWTAECLVPWCFAKLWRNTGPGMILCTVLGTSSLSLAVGSPNTILVILTAVSRYLHSYMINIE